MAMMMIMIFQVRSTCIALFLFIMNLFGGNLPVIVAPLRQDFDDDGDDDDYEMLMMVVMIENSWNVDEYWIYVKFQFLQSNTKNNKINCTVFMIFLFMMSFA